MISRKSAQLPLDAGRNKRPEVRISLRTKHPALARRIASWANARLEAAVSMEDLQRTIDSLKANLCTWTIENGRISTDGTPEDSESLSKFLKEHPDALQATRVQGISNDELAQRMNAHYEATVARWNGSTPGSASSDAKPSTLPANRMRMSVALGRFRMSKLANAENTTRTLDDKIGQLEKFRAHVARHSPELGGDPYVHEIAAHHVSSYLDEVPVRPARTRALQDHAASPKTVIKKISGLRTFFMYAHGELAATLINPTDGLASRKKSLIAQAAKQAKHYQPFDDSHLGTIFDPRTYLAYNRDADYFWAPLIALCTGARLAEIVTQRLDAIEEDNGNWFLNIVQENAKNSNSVRTIPIHRRLIGLGFVKYIRRMRDLGAEFLFPHRDLANATAQRDPSKNCSRHFGSYLKSLKITTPGLVFHSFRHTVIQALHDGKTPLSDSMQIVGHLAQDWAVQGQPQLEAGAKRAYLDVHACRCVTNERT